MVRYLVPVLFILLVLIGCSCGCIKIAQRSLSGNQTGSGIIAGDVGNQTASENGGNPARTTPPVTPAGQLVQIGNRFIVVSATTITPSGSTAGNATTPDRFVEVAPMPVMTSDEIQHATRFNETSLYNPVDYYGTRIPEFTKTYALRSNATALLANVTEGPLIVAFTIDTAYDCVQDPDSCKSSLTASVTRPWCIITIRDNDNGTIMAQDGYGREFSSATSNRTMTVYSQGLFHITLEGAGLDVTLKITTGSSSLATGATAGAGTAQGSVPPPDYQRMMRQRQGGV